MANIKIGNKTYEGINTLKVLLADNSGYALFELDSVEERPIPTLLSYEVFVPQNVSDEWTASGNGKTLEVSTSEFLELFYDGFVTNPPSEMTVTRKSIGKDQSGQYDMWEYDFKPINYTRTILLSSGMHTYELSASFGLANFISNLYTDTSNEAFKYIRENVRIKVIPIVNPWGFNQSPKTYGNINGVNINRNFDIDGAWESYPTYTPSQNEWNVKGEKPFSEIESVNLAKWCIDNYNAEFWIDCHTGVGYADKDLWVYYSSDSPILDRINNAISKIETWFKETYGSNCVTTRTIDSEGGIRLVWQQKICGVDGITLEQAPSRTTFGTANNNDSGDISNYSTNISTFVQEFLLEKYRDTTVIPIESASINGVTMAYDELSKTVEATITPLDTTQNKFKWTSSNESVVKVYGGTNKAILVNMGVGNATITLVNRYDSTIATSFEVEVLEENTNGDSTENEEPTVQYVSGYISSQGILTDENSAYWYSTSKYINATDKYVEFTIQSTYPVRSIMVLEYDENNEFIQRQRTEQLSQVQILECSFELNANTKKIKYSIENTSWNTEKLNAIFDSTYSIVKFNSIDNLLLETIIGGVDVTSGENIENTARMLTDFISVSNGSLNGVCPNGYLIKAFKYNLDKTFDSANPVGALNTNTLTGTVTDGFVRILFKKSDNSNFTEDELINTKIIVNGIIYKLKLDESI